MSSRPRPARSGLQLLPMANLATLLVPMGLMATQLVALRWLRPPPEPFHAENPQDGVSEVVVPLLRIEADGLRILGAETVLAGPDGQPLVPRTEGGPAPFDLVALRRLLGHVRNAYPRSDTLVVEQQVGASYEALVQIFAAVQRDEQGNDLFPRVVLR